MLRSIRSRRPHRPRYGVYICAVISALLLLVSVSLLYTRLSHSQSHHFNHPTPLNNDVSLSNPLISDDAAATATTTDDKIDELDEVVVDDSPRDDEVEDDDDPQPDNSRGSAGFFFDHVAGVIRRRLNKRKIEDWDEDYGGFSVGMAAVDGSVVAFGSDDVPVDMEVRRRMTEVAGVEDALMLKVGKRVSPLREGWGEWFDKKSDFLRRDKMFKSNLELLNPLHNTMLQDPDAVGVSGLTRGDKAVQKWWLSYFKKVPFRSRKKEESVNGSRELSEVERAKRKALDENGGRGLKNPGGSGNGSSGGNSTSVSSVSENVGGRSGEGIGEVVKNEFSGLVYADGKRWGFYPGLHPHLSFSDFMDEFFSKGCDLRVFMVWNSPAWMFSARHQRGLESLLSHHRQACVVVFSETIELDFFKNSFVKDGYKVAVAMPNLDELLKGTPAHIFASAWFEWRKTKHYATHFSELVRLAALYKYGGIYLDSDIIVLKSLSSLSNSVGKEDRLAGGSLNGAVMAFKKNSLFMMECLKEFYMTYDDTHIRWNGADLLTRVARRFLSIRNKAFRQMELNMLPPFMFFPIAPQNISRYFTAPATETEKAQQDVLFRKILNESFTFHFWNSLTSSLIPELESLATRLIDHSCIRCSDVL
ncbi:uncharacterized protein At4g19900 [Argentina anserina]|uniref:uncharacterized protein At4g19900 n=1 Tax=Argentina anserina TaxID=57926 RepID=UPI0021762CAF|nr:uncharacterized protein At4g19900 [Potentilla anserina]